MEVHTSKATPFKIKKHITAETSTLCAETYLRSVIDKHLAPEAENYRQTSTRSGYLPLRHLRYPCAARGSVSLFVCSRSAGPQ